MLVFHTKMSQNKKMTIFLSYFGQMTGNVSAKKNRFEGPFASIGNQPKRGVGNYVTVNHCPVV